MVLVRSKVEWSSATITNGERSVMIAGAHLMPEWSVGSSAFPLQVYHHSYSIDNELIIY